MAVEKSIAQLMATPEPAEVEVEAVIDEEAPLFASDDTVMLEDGSAIVGYVEEEKDGIHESKREYVVKCGN